MNARYLLAAAASAGIVFLGAANSEQFESGTSPVKATVAQSRIEGELPSFDGAGDWINSRPLTPAGLRGKVVLIEFWTYTCINWRRTLPYVKAWAKKYQNQGLVVIGVHTPEFSFEGNLDNVRNATRELGIDYPIAVDTEHNIWRAFGNQYWPALYLADAQGHIRYHRFGEGNYEETELAIQQLIAEAGHTSRRHDLVSIDPQGADAAADWLNLKSPETYTGYELAHGFASPGGPSEDRAYLYELPATLPLNEWALAGKWTVGREAVVLNIGGGHVVFRFHARDVNLIMGSSAPGTPVSFRVHIDGRPPAGAHGIDIDEQGNGRVNEPRMYQLIRQHGPIADRVFDIEFLGPGVEAFDFTFG